jgi:hypothetical protein
MNVFMVDRGLPGISMDDLAAAQQRAMATAEQFRADGKDVSCIRSTFVPGESHCMCLFDGADATLVAELNAMSPRFRIRVSLRRLI